MKIVDALQYDTKSKAVEFKIWCSAGLLHALFRSRKLFDLGVRGQHTSRTI